MTICEKLPSTAQSCAKIDCSKSAGRTILHPLNPAYYAYCFDYGNGTVVPLMFKCEFEQFETFNLSIGICTFNCKAKGNFQNPANCQQYYVCSASGVMADLLSCPNNYVFDGIGCTADRQKCQYPPPPREDIWWNDTNTEYPGLPPPGPF